MLFLEFEKIYTSKALFDWNNLPQHLIASYKRFLASQQSKRRQEGLQFK